jgi:hypothetical protein
LIKICHINSFSHVTGQVVVITSGQHIGFVEGENSLLHLIFRTNLSPPPGTTTKMQVLNVPEGLESRPVTPPNGHHHHHEAPQSPVEEQEELIN